MKAERASNCWFFDHEDENTFTCHRIAEQLFSTTTKYQEVSFIRCPGLGEVLVLDNKLQSAESDEYIYHEALVHPAVLAHPSPQTVLILGGGEGATLREVLKHSTVKKATMVDIDGELVEFCRKHLQKWHQGSFDDPRSEIIVRDAWDYFRDATNKFDVVIADISDPIEEGPALNIYTREFYEMVYNILTDAGIFVTQAVEVYYREEEYHSRIHKTVSSVFPVTESYCDYIPSYSAVWGFVIGSKRHSTGALEANELRRRINKRIDGELRYYDGETHLRIFSLPLMVRQNIEKQQTIATLAKPIKVFSA